MRDDDDYQEYGGRPQFPITVLIAGIAWIGFGCLILLNLLLVLAALGVVAQQAAQVPEGARGPFAAGATGGALCMGLFGAAFIFVGVQTVRGTAADTLGNSIGSLVFGVLNLGGALLQFSQQNVLAASISFLAGAGLVAAGVLALVGRSEYKAWRGEARRSVRHDDER